MTPLSDEPVTENCEKCRSALFRVTYDPKAMARSVECADCGSVVLLDSGTGFLKSDDDE